MIVVCCRLLPPAGAAGAVSRGLPVIREPQKRQQTAPEPLERPNARAGPEKGQDGLFLLGSGSGDNSSRFHHLLFFFLEECIRFIHNSGEFLFPG